MLYSGPLYICSDHAGYQLKRRLLRFFKNELKIKATDCGPKSYAKEDDFPDFVIPAAEKTVKNGGRLIACCGSGAGEVIAGNKVPGMRMTIGYNIEAAELAVKHNDANGLALAARVLTEEHAMAIVKKYLETTEAMGGKYARRRKKIDMYEKKICK